MRWSWLRDAVLPALQAITESLWIYAVATIVTVLAPLPSGPTFARIIGLLLVAAVAGRVSGFLPLRFPLNRLVLLPIALALFVYWLNVNIAANATWSLRSLQALVFAPSTLRPDLPRASLFLFWALALYLTGRGLLIGVRPQNTVTASRWFVGGAAVLVTVLGVISWTSAPTAQLPAGELRNVILGYFVAGLVMVALTHWQSVHRGAGVRPHFSLSWLVAITVPVVLVIAAGAVLVGDVGRAVQGTMFAWLTLLYGLVVSLAALIWHGILWIGYWLALALQWLVALFPSSPSRHTTASEPRWHPAPPSSRETDQIVALSVPQTDIVPFLAAILVLIAAALFIGALLRKRRSLDAVTVVEESESMWSWALLRRQIVDSWHALRRKFRARRAALIESLGARRPEEIEEFHSAVDMRRLYRAFLHWAAKRQQKRAPGTTPFEFARQVLRAIPLPAAHVDGITACYVAERYGTEHANGEQIENAKRLLGALFQATTGMEKRGNSVHDSTPAPLGTRSPLTRTSGDRD